MEAVLRRLLVGGAFGAVDPVNSRRMAAVRGKGTKPEIVVRRLVHGLGFRFRLHDRKLPGTPDIVFHSRRKIINVNGCFWHLHGCSDSHVPASRRRFWKAKLERNRERDRSNLRALRRSGWRVLTIWECQLAEPERLQRRIEEFLGRPAK
jgi:DNA mismatch endonuclease Vsr